MTTEKLTTAEAAEYLRLADRTLERWRIEGRGPRFIKVGAKVLYAKRELDRFLEAGERTSTADDGEGSR